MEDLALHALARTAPISRLAAEHEVSRKFIYRQRDRATDALHEAFFEEEARADEVLFYLHRRFLRSERSERIGKSPAELLTGETHPHWLEMLGYAMWVYCVTCGALL